MCFGFVCEENKINLKTAKFQWSLELPQILWVGQQGHLVIGMGFTGI